MEQSLMGRRCLGKWEGWREALVSFSPPVIHDSGCSVDLGQGRPFKVKKNKEAI